eukprot:948038-Prymnesium_polylepis.1
MTARGVFCDRSAPCRVASRGFEGFKMVNRMRTIKGFELQICLPHRSGESRLCEPRGELWQQVGARVGLSDGSAGCRLPGRAGRCPRQCVEYNLLLLTRWWRKIRARSPFITGQGDDRLPELLSLKQSATKETPGSSTPVSDHELHALHSLLNNAT